MSKNYEKNLNSRLRQVERKVNAMKNGGIDTKRRLKSNLIKKEGIVKKYFLLIIMPLIIIITMCKQPESIEKEDKKWNGREEFKEFIKLDLLPKELIYPNGEGKYAEFNYIKKDWEETYAKIITADNYKKVGEYYRELLPQKGWTFSEQSEEANVKVGEVGGFFIFDKNKREALITLEVTKDGGCLIKIIWRPFTG